MLLAVQFGLLLLAQAASNPDPAALAAPVARCRADRDPDDITVCGRRDGAQTYRLPAPEGFDPSGTVDSVSRERHRMLDVGAVGTQSCSAVGPGGWTGCEFNDWRHADEQYAGRNHTLLPRASIHVGVVNPARPR